MELKSSHTKNSIIVGLLLGDGYISPDGQLDIRHCIKQKDYLLYIANLIKNVFDINVQIKDIDNNGYLGVRLRARSKYFRNVRKYVYKPKKNVTRKMLNKLTPLGLALWYMDDGSLIFQKNKEGKIESRKMYLNTQGFSYEENLLIQQYFLEEWDISTKIHRDKTYYHIYFNSSEAKKFLKIIQEYIVDCMKYKLCMRYGARKCQENLCGHECNLGCCPLNCVNSKKALTNNFVRRRGAIDTHLEKV